MYRKVIYVVKSDLHYYPPCMSQILLLNDCEVDVEVWFGSTEKSAVDILLKNNIEYENLDVKKHGKSTIERIENWVDYRRKVAKKMHDLGQVEEVIFWFGTVESIIPLWGCLKGINYMVTSLELLDGKENRWKRFVFGSMACQARAHIACEETRAYIMKDYYGLKKVPYVMPNKPYCLGVKKDAAFSVEQTKQVADLLENKKYIIYQGIFQNTEYICELAKALDDMDSEYYLVMMGMTTHNENVIEEIRRIYPKVIFIPSIPAPHHLEITSHAKIGVVFYDGKTLNKAFCAPNKIYEYSGLGIPALANNIPGLKNTVGKAKAGVCVEFQHEKLRSAILEIEINYDEYSKNAIDFYEQTDNSKVMYEIMESLKIRTKEEQSECDF